MIPSQYSCAWQDDLTAMLGISLRGREIKEENEDKKESENDKLLNGVLALETSLFQTEPRLFCVFFIQVFFLSGNYHNYLLELSVA